LNLNDNFNEDAKNSCLQQNNLANLSVVPILTIQIKNNSFLEPVLVFPIGVLKDNKTAISVSIVMDKKQENVILDSQSKVFCYFSSSNLTAEGLKLLELNISKNLVYFNIPLTLQ
jgi:hypothetical protein